MSSYLQINTDNPHYLRLHNVCAIKGNLCQVTLLWFVLQYKFLYVHLKRTKSTKPLNYKWYLTINS